MGYRIQKVFKADLKRFLLEVGKMDGRDFRVDSNRSGRCEKLAVALTRLLKLICRYCRQHRLFNLLILKVSPLGQ